jgi:hypothetical protein
MMIKSLALAGLLSLAATAALADSLTATLASPVAKTTKFIASDTMWTCAGTTCSTTVASGDAQSAGGCRSLTKEVGAVSVYTGLDAAALAKCNAGRPGAPVQTATAAAH